MYKHTSDMGACLQYFNLHLYLCSNTEVITRGISVKLYLQAVKDMYQIMLENTVTIVVE